MTMASDNLQKGYVSVNGLNMYYEIHGAGQPLVLLHGAFSAIGTSFGELIPELAKTLLQISTVPCRLSTWQMIRRLRLKH